MPTLRQLVGAVCPEIPASCLPDRTVAGVECDSRRVGKDFVFVAIRGVKQDGSHYVGEALERGALAVLHGPGEAPEGMNGTVFLTVEDPRLALARLAALFHGQPATKLKTAAVTGTNGKTTCTYLIEHLLAAAGAQPGVIGTVNYRFAGREIPAVETTPGPLQIQEILSRMVEAGTSHAVMEASSHALDQSRVAAIDFYVALFTNLTQDHLDYHGTLEAYFEAKARLFTGLKSGATAVVNVDDEWGARLPARTRAKTITYSIDAAADLRAVDIEYGPDSTRFAVREGTHAVRATLPLVGRHNVYNALGALGVLRAFGAGLESAAKALESFPGVPGRLERVDGGQSFRVFVDFAHTPDGLENVLRALAPYRNPGKLHLVFGCGGDRDRGKRPKMAAVAARFADRVIVTSDNPRSEEPRAIADEIASGFPPNFRSWSVVLDRRKAIRQALLAAREGDIVLLAGKGHERTQIIGTQTRPFSDREEAEKVLSGH